MGMILLIEDDGATTRDLITMLELKHEIKHAYSYSSAIRTWEKYNGVFDCIILDLYIDPTGLKATHYFPLVGMAFFDDIYNGKTEEYKKNILRKTIIYSGYIKELKSKSRGFRWPLSQLKLIPKDALGISNLLEYIEQIFGDLGIPQQDD
jgi:hypothetical protein